MPVIPATQEAEAGELLECGRQRLQGAKIESLPRSLGKKVRFCLEKKKVTNCQLKLESTTCLHSHKDMTL